MMVTEGSLQTSGNCGQLLNKSANYRFLDIDGHRNTGIFFVFYLRPPVSRYMGKTGDRASGLLFLELLQALFTTEVIELASSAVYDGLFFGHVNPAYRVLDKLVNDGRLWRG